MQNLSDWVNGLTQDNSLIIVEGKRDKIALNKLGIENVYEINKPIYLLAELLKKEKKDVVILTDFDKEGRKLYFKLKQELQRNGIKINHKYRNYLFKSKISHIEGLFTYYKNHSKEFP